MLAGLVAVPLSASRVMPVLVPISVLFGVAVLWVFSRISNQQRIREVKCLIRAHLYELRLVTDEPALVWRAQLALLRDNVRYLALALRVCQEITRTGWSDFVLYLWSWRITRTSSGGSVPCRPSWTSVCAVWWQPQRGRASDTGLCLIHISEPTRRRGISYSGFFL